MILTQILIEFAKAVVKIVLTCILLGVAWIVFIIAREVGWRVKQENRKQYRVKQKQCGFCGPAGRYILVVAPDGYFEHGLYVTISGAYLQIYDGDHPGFIDNIEINYCPKCGRMLREVEDNANASI